jgi:ferrous iron transport protein A
MASLADLSEGQRAIIKSLDNEENAPKLLEMGFIPGTVVQMFKKAPLGCPLCFVFEDKYQISLRSSEARSIGIDFE